QDLAQRRAGLHLVTGQHRRTRPELRRRYPVLVAERAAEMRGVQESPVRADRSDRPVALRGITQVLTTPLQPAPANPAADGHRFRLEQLMQVAQRDVMR